MTTQIGIYKHYAGGFYRVLGEARESTNGAPFEDRVLVIYVSLTTGRMNAREQKEFHQLVTPDDGLPPATALDESYAVPRFRFVGEEVPADSQPQACTGHLVHGEYTVCPAHDLDENGRLRR